MNNTVASGRRRSHEKWSPKLLETLDQIGHNVRGGEAKEAR